MVTAGYKYKLLKEPKFTFSTRRIEKEGNLRMVGIAAQTQLNYLFGNDFNSSDFGYVMKGGKYYSQAKGTPLERIQKIIETSSTEQLLKLKKRIKILIN